MSTTVHSVVHHDSSAAAEALKEMQAVEPRITRAVYRVLDVGASAASRRSEGGTAPARVRNAVKDAKRRFAP